ncbi:MAG: hypothetical protein IPM91_08630 [Bacteroidetes bacterium]|nr:hypothetical protein [Bacteroidota bacterium]
MPAAGRKGSAVFEIGGDVFICGGNNAAQPALRENWKYTIATNSWQQLTDFPFRLFGGLRDVRSMAMVI